jgi:hypothetical protein
MSKEELTKFTGGAMFLRYISLQKDLKDLEKDLKIEWDSLQKSMIENNVTKVDGDWGSITLATRKNYTYIEGVADEFMKTVIDTAKVGAHVTLTGEVPKGVELNETKYLTKKFK